MTDRRPWIHSSRPLIFPILLMAGLGTLIITLSSLSFVDRALVALVDFIPRGLNPEFNLIAKLGDVPVLIVVAIVAAAYELFRRHKVRAIVTAASLSSLLAFRAIKELVRRARPVSEFVASHGLHDYSFPSGHSTGSAALYGILAVIIWNNSRRLVARIVTGLLILLIVLIGLSRVYLGAHYPTDVLGGWLLALIVVSILRSISLASAKRSQRPLGEALEDTTELSPTEA